MLFNYDILFNLPFISDLFKFSVGAWVSFRMDFFPILRGIGTAILAGIILRTIHAMVAPPGQLLRGPAISKLSKWRNLYMTGEVVQSEGCSSEFSLPRKRNETPIVSDLTVSDVENPSSLALTAGSNLGAPLSESTTAGNGTGNSFQSACQRESDAFRINSCLYVLNHP